MARRRVRASTVAGAVLAVGSITGWAFADAAASIKVATLGHLRAQGAAITVTVGVVCGPFEQAEYQAVSVQVTQRVGNAVASGVGFTDQFTCDGTVQQLEVSASAFPGGQPFGPGVAFAQANLQASGQSPDPTAPPAFESAATDAEILVSAS
jgi:hypothetical protein